MKVACLQMDISWEVKEDNFYKARKLISQAKDKACEIVCLPELFSTGFTMNSLKFAEDIPGETSSFLQEQAVSNEVYLFGTLIEKSFFDQKPRNTCIIYDKIGKQIAKYNKIQLFSLDKENENYHAGENISIFNIKDFRCSCFICFDLRFPELFTLASAKGALVVFVLANWPTVRKEHWRTFLRARAIENQFYVVGVNRVGKSPVHEYPGCSAIIDPMGNVVSEAGDSEEILIGDIELDYLLNVRKDFPFLKDKKPELYANLR